MVSNSKMDASAYTMLSIKLKFDMYIADSCFSFHINFGVSRIHSIFFFFIGYTKCHALRFIGSKFLFHFSIAKLLESVQN